MRIAASNIAWDTSEDAEVARLLRRYGVTAIDIAPGKYFPVPSQADDVAIRRVRSWWAAQEIDITGMQALLFGTSGLNVFGSEESRAELTSHLASVCRIAAGVGATRLVFGSPKNRDRGGLSDQAALEQSVIFFRKLGEIASAHGVLFCLEPNPPCYGSNFMRDSAETAGVVEAIGHPAIRMQLDTGALTINGETPGDVLPRYGSLIGHVHASEPELVPLGDGACDHHSIASVIREFLPAQIVSIEMVATKQESHIHSLERALKVAVRHYGEIVESEAGR